MSTLRRIAVRLLDFEWTILAAIVTASMVSARALWLGPGFAALFWLVRMSAGRGRPARTQADIPAALLVIMGLTSIWISIDRSQTIPTVLRLFLGIAFFYASIRSVNSELKIRNFLLGIAAVILGLSLLAPISVEWASTKIPLIPGSIYDRFTILLDDSIHRNVLSGFLLILLGPLLAFFLFAWHEARPWPKFLLTASASLGLSMLFLAQSRGALIALGLVFLLLIVLRFRRGWLLVPTSILGFILLVASPWRAQLLNTLASGVSLEGFEGRIEIWSRGIFMIQDFPITGIGMGLYGQVADLLYPFFFYPPGSIVHTHNLFLQVGVDLGIPGLVAWTAIFLLVVHRSWSVFQFGRDHGAALPSAIGAGLLASELGLAAHGLLDAVTWGMVKPSPVVWALWAFAFAAGNVFLPGGAEDENAKESRLDPAAE